MIVWNPTKETIVTKMHGAWFTFKPDTKKAMDQDKCRFIREERKETGLVVLPDQFDNQSEDYVEGFEKTEDGKKVLDALRLEGIDNLLAFHKAIIRNNQVSLRRDIAKENPAGDSAKIILNEMSRGEIESLQLVAKYQKEKKDHSDTRMKELASLLETVGPVGTD